MEYLKERPILYLVTDRRLVGSRNFLECIEQALRGGVNMLQLRDKGREFDEVLRTAAELKELTRHYNVPLIINDNPELAKAARADGVHMGPDDGDIRAAREYLGIGSIIGASARTAAAAANAELSGADYLGVGAVFGTKSKPDAETISPARLKEIARAVKIPVIAIGGVTSDNISNIKDCGAVGAAVISAVLGAEDIEAAAGKMLRELRSCLGFSCINGENTAVCGETVAEYLCRMGYNPNTVAVEYNGEILKRDFYNMSVIGRGDRIEIVCFVGGG